MLYVDIETDSNGKLLLIGVKSDSKPIDIVDNWMDVLRYGFINGEDTWLAHNGGGFDYLHLLNYLIRENMLLDFSGIVVGSRIIAMDIVVKLSNFSKDNYKCRLIDSFNLWPVSLDAAARALLNRSKIEIEVKPEKLSTSKLKEYLTNDIILLQDCYHEFNNQIEQLGYDGEPRITIASTALAVFESMSGYKIRDVSDSVNDLIANSYSGGRVQLFQPGEHKFVKVYDINSMYPAVMLENQYPYTGETTIKSRYNGENCAFISIHLHDIGDNKNSPIVRKGCEVFNGDLLVTSSEFAILEDINASMKVHECLVFNHTDKIFNDYINRLYKIRISNSPLAFVAKLLMNSLYGKYGQSKIGTELILGKHNDITDCVPVSVESDIFAKETEREVRHRHVAIAAMVTAFGRVKLYRSMLETGFDHIVYCDTDSIHVNSDVDIKTSSNLGDYKLEFTGSGIYLGKKLYQLYNSDTVKTVAKGIRHKENKVYGGNARLTTNDFRLLADDENATIACEFNAMPTLREVLRGDTPCKPKVRCRKIRQVH